MRFVAIFNQYQITHTVGFDSEVDALDFLFWGYEDQQLLPYGVYDKTTEQVTPYTHAGQVIHSLQVESMRGALKSHLAISPLPDEAFI
jgi:hypothetical protein